MVLVCYLAFAWESNTTRLSPSSSLFPSSHSPIQEVNVYIDTEVIEEVEVQVPVEKVVCTSTRVTLYFPHGTLTVLSLHAHACVLIPSCKPSLQVMVHKRCQPRPTPQSPLRRRLGRKWPEPLQLTRPKRADPKDPSHATRPPNHRTLQGRDAIHGPQGTLHPCTGPVGP